jgi:MFS family permease
MGASGFLYKLVLLLHLVSIVVGFGSNVVSSFLTARGRDLPPRERHALAHAAYQAGKALTAWPIVIAGVFGLLLVLLSDEAFKFSQTWVSLGFLLYFAMVAVIFFLIAPNARAIDALGTTLAGGAVTASKTGGPPREAVELDERDKKAAAFTGIVHLLWVLLMIDMIWKPGL